MLLKLFCLVNKYPHSTLVYSKLRVSRLPQETFSLFIEDSASLLSLKNQICAMLPRSNICLVDNSKSTITHNDLWLRQALIRPQDLVQQNNSQALQSSALEALISDQFSFFEVDPALSIAQIKLGVEIVQYNMSNNLNVPDFITENVIELNQQWGQLQAAQQVMQLTRMPSEIVSKEEIKQIGSECQKTIEELQALTKLIGQTVYNMGRGKTIMMRVTILKTMNFLWLFSLTYGKYGWDVGQPVAYLTILTVDLMAMMGLYNIDQSVTKWGQTDYKHYLNIANIYSRKNMLQWKLGVLWKRL